jgi:hypothetical protein
LLIREKIRCNASDGIRDAAQFLEICIIADLICFLVRFVGLWLDPNRRVHHPAAADFILAMFESLKRD